MKNRKNGQLSAAWIGFGGMVVAAIIGAIFMVISKNDDKPSQITVKDIRVKDTEGPVNIGVGGNVDNTKNTTVP